MGSGLTKSRNPSIEYLHSKKEINKKLDAELDKESRQEEEKIKLLLLGAGESGKSTIFKQMKIIYGTNFTEAERRIHTSTIHNNIILAMRVLIKHCIQVGLDADFPPEIIDHIERIKTVNENNLIDQELGTSILTVWNNHTMQATWERRHEYQIIESLRYYISRLEDIQKTDYIPTQDDVLHNRVRTSGIVTERYIIDNVPFEMYDVGGQRNERKKWIHCFEGVTAIIFVVALSEFDQVLYEDDKTNRMVEALKLFDDICNNEFFQNSSMILFFNKNDLFAEKIKTKSLKSIDLFQDYEGGDYDYDASVQYLVHRFLSLSRRANDQQIYYHVTCATDTSNIEVVFNACKDIVLRDNIRKSNLLTDYE